MGQNRSDVVEFLGHGGTDGTEWLYRVYDDWSSGVCSPSSTLQIPEVDVYAGSLEGAAPMVELSRRIGRGVVGP